MNSNRPSPLVRIKAEDQVPGLYSQENEPDPVVRVKFFTPSSSWTWYVTEHNPETDECFGLVDGFEAELGYFDLAELRSVKGPWGLPAVERDIYWTPKPLSQVREEIGR